MHWHLIWTSDNLRRLLIGDFPREAGGLLLTLALAVAGVILSTVLGTALALLGGSRSATLRISTVLYVAIFRNVPLVVLVFWAYFAPPYFGFRFSKVASVAIAIALFNAAYVAEILRAGMRTIAASQFEAAESLGLGRAQVLGWIVLPQAFFSMLPSLTSRCITVVKSTSLAFLIGLADVTEIGREINNRLLVAPVEVYFTLLLIYFLVNRALSAAARLLEDRQRFNYLFLEF